MIFNIRRGERMKTELKICVLNGSLRIHGVTEHKISKIINLIKLYSKEKNFNIKIQYIDIKDTKIKECQGCEYCFFNGKCCINDEIITIQRDLLWADIIIVGSPVYLNHIPSSLKKILDRISYWAHLMLLIGKRGIIVTSASQSGLEETTEYLDNILSYFGLSIDFSLQYNRFLKKESLSEIELKKLTRNCIDKALSNDSNLSKKVYSIFQLYKEHFNKNSDFLQDNFEYKYWKEKGYLDV